MRGLLNGWTRRGRVVRCAGSLAVVVALAATTVPARAGQIRFCSGTVELAERSPAELKAAVESLGARSAAQHVVVRFAGPLSEATRAALRGAGVEVQAYLSDHAWLARVDAAKLDAETLSGEPALRDVRPIEPVWKLHPILAQGEMPEYAIVEPSPDASRPEENVVGAYIVFHADVPLLSKGIDTVLQHRAVVRDTLESINGLVIELPQGEIDRLAAQDAVLWIEPPLPRFSEMNNSNRARVGADIAQQPPYGLTGAGVNVLVYDGGFALAGHQDFGGRLTVRDNSGISDHSTHVAGTIGGSGALSGGNYRGMAPGVTMQSYGFDFDGSGIFLYSNPGDIEDDYDEAINVHSVDISNNSIGTNTCWNGFPCAITGDYGVTSQLIDTIVRGDGTNAAFSSPFRVVWANGNERNCTGCPSEHQAGYHSTAPPALAKNHITVGALNSNNDTMTAFSSWGPADDGRLKPDISAPGCQSNEDFNVTSCSSSGGYTGKCGTSMASPTVCGIGALMLQEYRNLRPGEPDPRNSTLKVLLAHTAVDLGNPGPDYSYGYGSVRAPAAIDLMRSGNYLEDSLGQGESKSLLVVVNPGDPELRITLAWDDYPAVPLVVPSLVNDLDLRVLSPSGTDAFPWTLNPASPSAPAVRTQADHLNNIEQVYVANPEPGAWRVEIVGFNVPQGPQAFSLAASPQLINCSPQGVADLDRAHYTCAGTAELRVVDCDLNTDDEVVDTVLVTVSSNSEPAGEAVLLTETTPESALFTAPLPLNVTDEAGQLHVADGDTITLRYVDADNGQGGQNVQVTAVAVVDCSAPLLTRVDVEATGTHDALVTIETNEQTIATVRHGTSCAGATNEEYSFTFGAAHAVPIGLLEDDTDYFVTVEVRDRAGNAAIADNGGACYSFRTPAIPDFFTQQFSGSNLNDLDNLSLRFVPNGTFEFYRGCTEAIDALPTDPTGGFVLAFAPSNNDGWVQINLTGGATVSLYGVSYHEVMIGSNGYVTFGGGSGDASETLAEHFALPRIAGLYDDLNPAAGGSVRWQQLADRAVVTWLEVPELNAGTTNTFQIEMFFDGEIALHFLTISANDGIVGLSSGAGLSPDFSNSDLSTMGLCGPLLPVATDLEAETEINTPVQIALAGDDPDGEGPPLAYVIKDLPAHGLLRDPLGGPIFTAPYTLAGGGNVVIYEPGLWYQGFDILLYSVTDGVVDSNTAQVTVLVGAADLLYNFPLDASPGWTIGSGWGYGTPSGGGSFNKDPISGFTGTRVYGFNLSGDYPHNMLPSYLRTTALDCSGRTGVTLRFRRWLGVHGDDRAAIEVSNNAINWFDVWENDGQTIADTSWQEVTYDISNVADNRSTVYVRWSMGPTDTAIAYPGWNIDDVQLWVSAPVFGIPGDIDGDGDVDLADFATLSTCFGGPGATTPPDGCEADDFAASDLDGDGDVDLGDFSTFSLNFTG